MKKIMVLNDFLRKERFNLSQVLTICILVLIAIVLFALASCSKDDDTFKNNNRDGQPYKFRVEYTLDNPDNFYLSFEIANYNFVDETGLPRTIWICDENSSGQSYAVPSPLIKEFELPHNFNKIALTVGVYFVYPYQVGKPILDRQQETMYAKIYVNNKLLAETSAKFGIVFSIVYDKNSKKYIMKYSGGNEFELSKLD